MRLSNNNIKIYTQTKDWHGTVACTFPSSPSQLLIIIGFVKGH